MSEELFPGLPDELMDFTEDISKNAETSVNIKLEKRKYGKIWAVISNLNLEKDKLKKLLKILKRKLACGGTMKNNCIELLFGKTDKTKEIIKFLELEGFNRENINISKK
jgi:translation initiation factor 1